MPLLFFYTLLRYEYYELIHMSSPMILTKGVMLP
jgi:hypothetical protein